MVYFEWDLAKAERNLRIHGISFEDVRPVFYDSYRLTQEDSVVDGEIRWRTVGMMLGATIVLVVHLEEDFGSDLFVRIISARRATPGERSDYEQNRANDF